MRRAAIRRRRGRKAVIRAAGARVVAIPAAVTAADRNAAVADPKVATMVAIVAQAAVASHAALARAADAVVVRKAVASPAEAGRAAVFRA
jgi:hypothetical protein